MQPIFRRRSNLPLPNDDVRPTLQKSAMMHYGDTRASVGHACCNRCRVKKAEKKRSVGHQRMRGL
jgi:hypothetical protein